MSLIPFPISQGVRIPFLPPCKRGWIYATLRRSARLSPLLVVFWACFCTFKACRERIFLSFWVGKVCFGRKYILRWNYFPWNCYISGQDIFQMVFCTQSFLFRIVIKDPLVKRKMFHPVHASPAKLILVIFHLGLQWLVAAFNLTLRLWMARSTVNQFMGWHSDFTTFPWSLWTMFGAPCSI